MEEAGSLRGYNKKREGNNERGERGGVRGKGRIWLGSGFREEVDAGLVEAADELFEADARCELVARNVAEELLVDVEAAFGEGGVRGEEGAVGDGLLDQGPGFRGEGVVGEDVPEDFDLMDGDQGGVTGGVAGVLADADEGLEEDAGGRVAEAAEGEFEVFGDVAAELGAEAADAVEELAGEEEGGGPDGLTGEDAVVKGAAEDEVAGRCGVRVGGGKEVGWEGVEFCDR